MPRFAANLSTLYPEHAFLDRFAAAARDGFTAVEFQFREAHAPQAIRARLADHGLQLVLFNAPPGTAGERGLACLAGREADFRASVEDALRDAATFGCPRVHVLAGIVPEGEDRAALRATYVANLRWAAGVARAAGVRLMIEPINTRDIPRYFLNRQDHAHELVQEIGSDHVQVQFDLYHCQVVEGDVASKIRQYLPSGRVGHMQIAGVPQRQEPDLGELHYPYLFSVIDEVGAQCGWDGWVGCEYRPAGGTSEGLGWLRRAATPG